jgi:hypothetical protein
VAQEALGIEGTNQQQQQQQQQQQDLQDRTE